MSFKTTYKLIQQTPLIHFQHEQNGATLRATEVKPKLDKFIIKKLGGKDNVPKNWLIPDTNALNYKMRIVATGTPSYINLGQNTDYDIFYGNMGDSEKKGACSDCEMTITCFVSDLKKCIDELIEEFFIVVNFGTMQNKGFGSYIIENSDVSPRRVAECLKDKYGAKDCYFFKSKKPSAHGQRDFRFKNIKTLYSVMKSGINFRDYHRSFLFEYCHEEMKTGNEKAAMKANHISPWSNGEPVKNPLNRKNFWDFGGHDYEYVRAVLGVGEHIEYITGFHFDDRKGRNVPDRDKETIKISNPYIDRLASPIRFKVIDDTVYMFAARINTSIFNKDFRFTNGSGEYIVLKTPENFDIDKFLSWFVQKYNLDSQIKNKRGEPVTYSIGTTINKVV